MRIEDVRVGMPVRKRSPVPRYTTNGRFSGGFVEKWLNGEVTAVNPPIVFVRLESPPGALARPTRSEDIEPRATAPLRLSTRGALRSARPPGRKLSS